MLIANFASGAFLPRLNSLPKVNLTDFRNFTSPLDVDMRIFGKGIRIIFPDIAEPNNIGLFII
jgi:hypothetical protein